LVPAGLVWGARAEDIEKPHRNQDVKPRRLRSECFLLKHLPFQIASTRRSDLWQNDCIDSDVRHYKDGQQVMRDIDVSQHYAVIEVRRNAADVRHFVIEYWSEQSLRQTIAQDRIVGSGFVSRQEAELLCDDSPASFATQPHWTVACEALP